MNKDFIKVAKEACQELTFLDALNVMACWVEKQDEMGFRTCFEELAIQWDKLNEHVLMSNPMVPVRILDALTEKR